MPKRILSVTQLNAYIKGVFEDELILHNVTVAGEIEEFKVAGGTTYITLRDSESRLSCVIFSVYEPLPKGLKVELDGGIKFYPKTARVSFIVRELRPAGEGEQYLAYLKLKDRLEKEGIFSKKKPFPARINSVAVVTSETGAVIRDFVSVLRAAGVNADIKVLAVRVQGAGAENEIKRAAELINRYDFCDIAVFMRGGGSESDLEAFNTETAARAVFSCRAHTISAVGHETNRTLTDLAADTRAGTPSIAAQIIAEAAVNIRERVLSLAQTLAKSAERLYNKKYARLASASAAVAGITAKKTMLGGQRVRYLSEKADRLIRALLDKNAAAVKTKSARICAAVLAHLDAAEKKLESASYRLDAQSPLKTLAKGYARAQKAGVPVTRVAELAPGDHADLFYQDGKAGVRVEEVRLFNE
ncbi:MAG: exodeoxyribonuclease VII large subunit [Firmicutes bacterium]|nr:exodeoxyribonuclease VII large subunit [Bacillota bacterium]